MLLYSSFFVLFHQAGHQYAHLADTLFSHMLNEDWGKPFTVPRKRWDRSNLTLCQLQCIPGVEDCFQYHVKGQPKWCEKGKLTFPDVPSTIMNQTGPGICDHINDSGACFYVRKRASNSKEKRWAAPILQRILLRIMPRYRYLKPMPMCNNS